MFMIDNVEPPGFVDSKSETRLIEWAQVKKLNLIAHSVPSWLTLSFCLELSVKGLLI